MLVAGVSTLELDSLIERELEARRLFQVLRDIWDIDMLHVFL